VRTVQSGFRTLLQRACCCTLLLLAHGAAYGADSTVTKEYQLKAAFLYNFSRFIEWPPKDLGESRAPIVIGVLKSGPFGEELERVVAGRQVNGRSLMVKVMKPGADASTVHLLFVHAGEEHRAELATLLAEQPAVVTVGESERFAALGGMITFVPEADKVRFTINLGAAEQTGLKLSAQLLKLASAVRRKP
jgi:hypothetical protein